MYGCDLVHPQQIDVDPLRVEFGEDVAVEVSKHHAATQAEPDLSLLYAENALQAERDLLPRLVV